MLPSFIPSFRSFSSVFPFSYTSSSASSNIAKSKVGSCPFVALRPLNSDDPVASVSASIPKREGSKAERRLHQLLKLNHSDHAVALHRTQYCSADSRQYNLIAPSLILAYVLNESITADDLNRVYESYVATIPANPDYSNGGISSGDCGDHDTEMPLQTSAAEPWRPAPVEISRDDWQDYLGCFDYQRAFLDFFEDWIVEEGYDWRRMVKDVMCSEIPENRAPFADKSSMQKPTFWHVLPIWPLVHLACGWAVESREVVTEALVMAALSAGEPHQQLESKTSIMDAVGGEDHSSKGTYETRDPLDILSRLRHDRRFDDLKSSPAENDSVQGRVEDSTETLIHKYKAIWSEYLDMWDLKTASLTKQFELSQRAAAFLLISVESSAAPAVLIPAPNHEASTAKQPVSSTGENQKEEQQQQQQGQQKRRDQESSNSISETTTNIQDRHKSHQKPFLGSNPNCESLSSLENNLICPLLISHALRILLPTAIPIAHHQHLLRRWLLLTLCVYVLHGRPEIDMKRGEKGTEGGEKEEGPDDWNVTRKRSIAALLTRKHLRDESDLQRPEDMERGQVIDVSSLEESVKMALCVWALDSATAVVNDIQAEEALDGFWSKKAAEKLSRIFAHIL